MTSPKVDYMHFDVHDWIDYTQQQHARSIDMSLERITAVWHRLGGEKPPLVVTVAGTNGKGSCVSMLSAVLQEAGYKTGCFTSPHLIRYNERIAINDGYASDEEICAAFSRIEQARAEITLTYFEYSTLNALLIFQARGVEAAVMEVGMGGRLDSVNMLDNDIAMITSIGFDHTQWLGDTLEKIGAEKAGVFRSNRVGVFADTDMPHSILEIGKERGTHLCRYAMEYSVEAHADGSFDFYSELENVAPTWRHITNLKPPFLGEHQMRNAAGVVCVLAHLAEQYRITTAHLKNGLAKARLAGRCQLLQDEPEVIVDVAHNEASITQLVNYLDSLPVKPMRAIFGALADKELSGIMPLLRDKIDNWDLVTIEGERGQSSQQLKNKLISLGISAPMQCYDSATEAYKRVLIQADKSQRVLVFGSFYIAGDILAYHQQLHEMK